jgi:hypothetical protein
MVLSFIPLKPPGSLDLLVTATVVIGIIAFSYPISEMKPKPLNITAHGELRPIL